MSGFVHLVGAGPGDPELITLKGARLLAEADAIVHDRLVDPALLASARSGALRFDVGKEGHGASVPQESTSDLLVRLARSGLQVVRLKQGDPFVFGRGGEEVLALEEAGVPYEVVPGITAGLAGPAAAGIPVTHRGVARSVAFVTAATETGLLEASEWANVALSDTIVVFMARHGATIAGQALLDAGRDPRTPVAVITDATRPDQDVRLIDIGVLATEGIASNGRSPAERRDADALRAAGAEGAPAEGIASNGRSPAERRDADALRAAGAEGAPAEETAPPDGRPVLLVVGEVAAFAQSAAGIASAVAA